MGSMEHTFECCPISIKLAGKRCLIVGGGPVAERKVTYLLKYGAEVVVVSPTVTVGLKKLAAGGLLTCIMSKYKSDFLDRCFLAVGAAGDRNVNAALASDCKKRNILVNIADSPEESSFLIPAVLQRDLLQIAVSTGGSSPALARRLRDELGKEYGPDYGRFAVALSELRRLILAKIACPVKRAALLKKISAPAYFQAFKELPPESFKRLVESMVEESGAVLSKPTKEVKL